MPNTVKKIDLGSGNPYDITAKYIIEYPAVGDPIEHDWNDITELIGAGIQLVPLNTLPAADASAYASYSGKIVLIPIAGSDDRADYIITRSGEEGSYTYAWDMIGTTAADVATKVDKGTYTSEVPSTNTTSAYAGETVTTSSAGEGTSTGTATITYNEATITGGAGAVTISGTNFTFTGTSATLGVSISYTPEGTLSGTVEVPKHSHTVHEKTTSVLNEITFTANSLPTRASFDYVSGVKESGGTADAITELTTSSDTFATSISAPTTSVYYGATVNASGVLSFSATYVVESVTISESTTALTGVSAKTTKTVILNTGLTTSSAYQITGVGTSATLTTGTTIVLATGTTLSEQASVTIDATNFTFNGSATNLEQVITYTPSGTIGGEQEVASHTHSVINTPTSTVGTASVAVGNHTHKVDIPSHTHDLGNHTHDINLN